MSSAQIQKDIHNVSVFLKTRRPDDLAPLIDHTCLKPTTTFQDIEKLCQEACEYSFRSVCVPPSYVAFAQSKINTSKNILLCTVISFPFGYQSLQMKKAEIQEAIDLGVHEIDFVQNLGFVYNHQYEKLQEEFLHISDLCKKNGVLSKVILETSLLDAHQISECCRLAVRLGINVVKTSTGYGKRGASEEDIRSLLEAIYIELPEEKKYRTVGIKASGGISSFQQAYELLLAGSTCLGSSKSVEIMCEEKKK
jgi:deoxyribose-phosphate aldolase